MAECADKNMIDKDEYPQTAELERRCVAILADLWHAPDPTQAVGCSTTGSSEAAMLAGLALQRRWAARVGDRSRRPNLVMGANVQVCWDKFCRYWDVEPRLVPMAGRPLPPRREGGRRAGRRRHDRRRRDPRVDLRRQLRTGRRHLRRPRRARGVRRAGRPRPRRCRVRRLRRAVPGSRAVVGLRAAARRVDQLLRPQVRVGLPGRRLGAVARSRRASRRNWSST